MNTYISILKEGENLKKEQAKALLVDILNGVYSDNDIFQFLTLYEKKMYHWQEVVGFVQAMKETCVKLSPKLNAPIIDVCGTGGSNMDRFNISTCVSFVLAASNIYVAKHGNYGSKRPNGSFNFLEELHIPFEFEVDEINTLLKESFCCFLFARKFHPSMRHVANARKKYAKRCIFNYLGPFANPISVDYQLIGLANEDKLPVLIETVRKLKRKHVVFCIGGDGRDEISLIGVTKIISVTPKKIKSFYFNFSKEIEPITGHYKCGDSLENAKIFVDICMNKKWDHPLVKHIAINVAAALYCLGQTESLIKGYKKAMELFETDQVVLAINRYKSIAADMSLNQ